MTFFSLLEGFESTVCMTTEAVLFMSHSANAGAGSKWSGRITTVTERVTPEGILAQLHSRVGTTKGLHVPPPVAEADIKVYGLPPAKNSSDMFTSTAAEGPLFRTCIVYVASVPASTGSGVTFLLTSSMSATGSTLTVAVSLLFVKFGSPTVGESAVAVLTSTPSAIGLCTVMVTFTSSLTFISPKGQTTKAAVTVHTTPPLSVVAVSVVAGLPAKAETY